MIEFIKKIIIDNKYESHDVCKRLIFNGLKTNFPIESRELLQERDISIYFVGDHTMFVNLMPIRLSFNIKIDQNEPVHIVYNSRGL